MDRRRAAKEPTARTLAADANDETRESADEELRASLASADDDDLGVWSMRSAARPARTISDARRRGPLEPTRGPELLTLVEDDGVLRFEFGSGFSQPARTGRRARRADGTASVRGIDQLRFEPLEPNKIGQFLVSVDEKLTPRRDLLRFSFAGGRVSLVEEDPVSRGRILVIVHGTFSESRQVFDGLAKSEPGKRFLTSVTNGKRYAAVYGFDHPTLSVDPRTNAADLAHLLRRFEGEVDILCHSRGGLVSRWWAEHFAARPNTVRNVITVGSPLAGTSLAAPAALKRVLDLFANILDVIGKGLLVTTFPVATIVRALVRVVGTILSWTAKSPVLDAAVALIPGLEAMSRVRGNAELDRLWRVGRVDIARYAAVTAEFEPEPVGWKFWRFFTRTPLTRLADSGADFLFDGANDLVVDTESMSVLQDDGTNQVAPARRRHFAKTEGVHHLNYFERPETIAELESWLA